MIFFFCVGVEVLNRKGNFFLLCLEKMIVERTKKMKKWELVDGREVVVIFFLF
jgi:hypothetical protein